MVISILILHQNSWHSKCHTYFLFQITPENTYTVVYYDTFSYIFIPIGFLVAGNRTSLTILAVRNLLRMLFLSQIHQERREPGWDSTHSETTYSG